MGRKRRMENKKFDCYSCKYRGKVAGSVHSSCNHPSLGKIINDPFGQMMATFASVGRVSPIAIGSKELNIKGNSYGIKSGWFNFPYNFDPIWLDNCDGFEAKEIVTKEK